MKFYLFWIKASVWYINVGRNDDSNDDDDHGHNDINFGNCSVLYTTQIIKCWIRGNKYAIYGLGYQMLNTGICKHIYMYACMATYSGV